MKPLVSIIIPAFNRSQELEACLKSVRRLSFSDYEIIVIDDHGKESLSLVCEKYEVEVYHRNDKNSGPTISKNIGAGLAKGKFLWFLDSDTQILSSDVLTNMISLMDGDPSIGCLGGELFNVPGKEQPLVKVHKTFINGDGFPRLIDPRHCTMIETGFLASANCFTRYDLYKRVSGFRDIYYYLYEDIDFCWKIKKLGYRIVADFRCAVLHNPSTESRFSSLYKLHKKRVLFVLLNKNIFIILLLPFLDLYYNLRYFKQKKKLFERNNTLVNKKNKTSFAKGILDFGLSLVSAYFYNILFLPKILLIRFQYEAK
jgi:GT2 family glycosyltransferase